MKVILDAGCMEEKEETHVYLKEKLALPEYYGNNLDALYDCLTELTDTEIVFMNTDMSGKYFKQVFQVFVRAEKENNELYLSVCAPDIQTVPTGADPVVWLSN